MNSLFERFPALAGRIPWRSVGSFPTPVEELALPAGRGDVRLFIKRDDLSSPLYGGNKVRKLEHFLADAERRSRTSLITLGGVGSNHALATAAHGAAHGFAVDLALYDQPVTPFVKKNLGGFLEYGARLHYAGNIARAFWIARTLRTRALRGGESPYFIMVGGSSRLGCVGYVTAGLELGQQVAAGLLPAPDRIFIPLGTCGTSAGLVVGLRLAGLSTRVTAVRVADPIAANPWVMRHLAQDVANYLHQTDSSVPRIRITTADFDVLYNYLGDGYGHPTAAGESALRWAAGLELETTYSGKALAACLDFCAEAQPGQTILFWSTFSSASVPAPRSWAGLPPQLQHILTP